MEVNNEVRKYEGLQQKNKNIHGCAHNSIRTSLVIPQAVIRKSRHEALSSGPMPNVILATFEIVGFPISKIQKMLIKYLLAITFFDLLVEFTNGLRLPKQKVIYTFL